MTHGAGGGLDFFGTGEGDLPCLAAAGGEEPFAAGTATLQQKVGVVRLGATVQSLSKLLLLRLMCTFRYCLRVEEMRQRLFVTYKAPCCIMMCQMVERPQSFQTFPLD